MEEHPDSSDSSQEDEEEEASPGMSDVSIKESSSEDASSSNDEVKGLCQTLAVARISVRNPTKDDPLEGTSRGPCSSGQDQGGSVSTDEGSDSGLKVLFFKEVDEDTEPSSSEENLMSDPSVEDVEESTGDSGYGTSISSSSAGDGGNAASTTGSESSVN